MIVEVVPAVGGAWLGWFEADVVDSMNGAFACPSENDLLVVSGGNGYVVSAAHPGKFEILPGLIQGVARVPGMPLMAVWDEQDIALYGRSGMVWWAERVAEEGLRITAITPESIAAYVPNFSAGAEQLISIDVATGHVHGAWLRHGPDNVIYPRIHHAQSRGRW